MLVDNRTKISSASNPNGRHPTGHGGATSASRFANAHNNLIDNATGVKVVNSDVKTSNYIAGLTNCVQCHNPHTLKPHSVKVEMFDNYSDFEAAKDTLAKFNWSSGCMSCHRNIGNQFVNIRYKDGTAVAPLGKGDVGGTGSFKDKANATQTYDFSAYYTKIKPSNWVSTSTTFANVEDGSTDHLTWLSEKSAYLKLLATAPSGISPFMADNKSYFPNRHIITKGCGYTKEGCHILNPNPLDDLTVAARLSRTPSRYVNVQSNFGCTTCHYTKGAVMGFSQKEGADNHTNSIVMGKHSNFGCGFGRSTITGAEIACHASGYTSSVHGTSAVVGAGYSASGSRVSFQFYAWDNNTDNMDNNSVTDWYQEAVAEHDFEDSSIGSLHKKKGVTCADCHDPHFVNRDAPAAMGLTKGCFDSGCHTVGGYTHGQKSYSRPEYTLKSSAACAPCHTNSNEKLKGNLYHTAKEKAYNGTDRSVLNYMVVYPNGNSTANSAALCAAEFDNNTAGKLPLPYGYTSVGYGGSAGSCIIKFD